VGRQEFIAELEALGHKVERDSDHEDRIKFPYEIPVGKFAGRMITLGLVVQGDFPMNPPASGPHLTPELLPIHTQSTPHPVGGVHRSEQFGDGWQYWSRPCENWAKTDRTAKAYMAFIRRLFETQ
jgi:hypothetical protein